MGSSHPSAVSENFAFRRNQALTEKCEYAYLNCGCFFSMCDHSCSPAVREVLLKWLTVDQIVPHPMVLRFFQYHQHSVQVSGFSEGLYISFCLHWCACCDQLAVMQEPVGRKQETAELLWEFGKLNNTLSEVRGFLRCSDLSGSFAPLLLTGADPQLLGVDWGVSL